MRGRIVIEFEVVQFDSDLITEDRGKIYLRDKVFRDWSGSAVHVQSVRVESAEQTQQTQENKS